MTAPQDFRPDHVHDLLYVVEGNPDQGEAPYKRFAAFCMQINNDDTINVWYLSPVNYGAMDNGGSYVNPGVNIATNVPHGNGKQGHTYCRGWEI